MALRRADAHAPQAWTPQDAFHIVDARKGDLGRERRLADKGPRPLKKKPKLRRRASQK